METRRTSFLLAENAPRSHPVRNAMAGLVTLAVAMGVGRFAFTPVMPWMLTGAGRTFAQAGWLASSNYAGYLLGAMVAVLIQTRPEPMIRAGLMSIGITTVAMGLFDGLSVWIAFRLLAGMSSAWVLIGVSGWCIDRLTMYKRPLLSSLVFSGVGIGIATAGLACIALTRYNARSASVWICLGITSLLLTTLIWRNFSAAKLVAPPAIQTNNRRFHWHGDPIRLVCCYGFFGLGYIIPATNLSVMARSALHGSEASVWSWPVFGIAAAVSTLAVATLRRRMGNRSLWAASHWIMAIGILLPVVWPNVLTVFSAAMCVGSTFMVITLVALQEAKPVAGTRTTLLIAAMTCAFAIAQIIGPMMISSAGVGEENFSKGLFIAAVLLVCSTLLLKPSTRNPSD